MKFLLLLVFAIAVFAVDSRYSSRSKHKIRVSSDGDQDPDTHQNQKIFPEEPVSTIVDEAQKLKDWVKDELGPPISPEEFAKARNDSTLTAPPPDGGKAIEESGEYQGDIKLTPKQRSHMRKGRIATWALNDETSRLWANGIIPYTIDSVFNERSRQVIARAIEEFHDRTCLRFVGRTSQTDYVHIVSRNGCNSPVGHYVGIGQHFISLSQDGGCINFGIVIHEFMHVAGFWHEQNRNDRDNYISINSENIIDRYIFAFRKDTNVHGLGLPYDYQSVMHYGTHAFSKNGQPTITAKKEGVTLGQYNGFSELDVKGINTRYQCEEGGSCIDGVSIGSQCLVFNQDAQTWEEAKSSCEAVGMKLASLTDPAAVLEYTKEKYGIVPFYVGGTDNANEGTWEWVNGQPISTDFPWLPGEPNNYPPNGEEDCLVINFAGGFNDDVCQREKPFICEVA